jgi:iron(III) transport system substrate-binding protein
MPGIPRALRADGKRSMTRGRLSRRDVPKAAGANAATVFAAPVCAQVAEPSEITSALVAVAKKEGKVAFYTSMDLPVAERVGRVFEAKFPGITVRVERSGAERLFQRIQQEYNMASMRLI